VTNFLHEGRSTKDPYLRSASLSSAFERWQHKYHKYPIHVPDELRRTMPVPTPQLAPKLERTTSDPAHEYMCKCCEQTLKKCNHPHAHHYAHPETETAAPASGLLHSDHEVDIDFDVNSSITAVSIWSFFVGVTEQQANELVEMADPPKWHEAVPTFFEASCPGTLDETTGTFVANLAQAEKPKYQLLEYVDWHWSPQVDGGMVNVLEIERHGRKRRSAADLVDEVLLHTKADPPYKTQLASKAPGNTPELLDEYDYRLVRSVQSKFVASWETGGIDVDEGTYAAAWMAPSHERREGALFVYSKKSLRYSQRADVIPGFRTMLNLLAPAVTTMLMTHLGYSGIVHFLTRSQNGTATAATP